MAIALVKQPAAKAIPEKTPLHCIISKLRTHFGRGHQRSPPLEVRGHLDVNSTAK